jgi:hypothetical protein
MRREVTQRRIEAFGKRFGEAHLYLAYHAAFPLALTPDLLYRLWAKFQRDIHGKVLNIPWIAVADLLLSSLCDQVGHELYEMENEVRNALLMELKFNPRFGVQRMNELSDFLLVGVQQQLESPDIDTRDLAQAQRWTALAYTRPSEAAHEIASAFSRLKLEDGEEWIRLTSLIETLAEPLREFNPLLIYAHGMKSLTYGDKQGAKAQFDKLLCRKHQIQFADVTLSIPKPQVLIEPLSHSPKWTQVKGVNVFNQFINLKQGLNVGKIDQSTLWKGGLTIVGMALAILVLIILSRDNVPPSRLPRVQISTNPDNNPFSRIAFPQATCGDPLPQDTTAYPVNLYPVFINYSDRNFSEVKSKFCQDALSKVRENGQRAIQVASFLTPERAEAFKDLMIDSFGSGEVGEPTIIDRVL